MDTEYGLIVGSPLISNSYSSNYLHKLFFYLSKTDNGTQCNGLNVMSIGNCQLGRQLTPQAQGGKGIAKKWWFSHVCSTF